MSEEGKLPSAEEVASALNEIGRRYIEAFNVQDGRVDLATAVDNIRWVMGAIGHLDENGVEALLKLSTMYSYCRLNQMFGRDMTKIVANMKDEDILAMVKEIYNE